MLLEYTSVILIILTRYANNFILQSKQLKVNSHSNNFPLIIFLDNASFIALIIGWNIFLVCCSIQQTIICSIFYKNSQYFSILRFKIWNLILYEICLPEMNLCRTRIMQKFEKNGERERSLALSHIIYRSLLSLDVNRLP